MPTALIEVRRHYPEAEESAIIDAVHAALVTAFRIPVGDRTVYAGIVDGPVELGVPHDHVTITLREPGRELGHPQRTGRLRRRPGLRGHGVTRGPAVTRPVDPDAAS